jgi:hypothetical protein
MIECVLGNADVAFLGEVIPDSKLQEFSHYVSLARTVVRRFSIDPSWSKKPSSSFLARECHYFVVDRAVGDNGTEVKC